MLIFATCIILKRQVGLSVALLATVIISQAVAYGLFFNIVSTLSHGEFQTKLNECVR